MCLDTGTSDSFIDVPRLLESKEKYEWCVELPQYLGWWNTCCVLPAMYFLSQLHIQYS